jgi:hypothetical protein
VANLLDGLGVDGGAHVGRVEPHVRSPGGRGKAIEEGITR